MGRHKNNATGGVKPAEDVVLENTDKQPANEPVLENAVQDAADTVTPKAPKEIPKTDDGMVMVSRVDLEKLISTVESQAKDIDLLYRASDKNRMAKARDLEGENLIKQCKVSTWMDTGKLIVGWKLTKNISQIVMGKEVVDQQVTTILEDGSTIDSTLLEWYRSILIKEEADILSRNEESDSKGKKTIYFKLQFPSGKNLLINSAFVN